MTESNPASVAAPVTGETGPVAGTHQTRRHPRSSHHGNSFHKHVAHASHAPLASPAKPPADVAEALKSAMEKEGVPNSWEAGLHFIMQRESSGKVGASNGVDTARGLFQLTKASYHLNPHGAASFGNAVEEAQGGIRYVAQRYQTADNAVGFWKKHGWY